MPLVVIVLALMISFTCLGAVGHAHDLAAPRPLTHAAADDAREGEAVLSTLTRGLVDHHLGMDERLSIAAVRQQKLRDLMEQDPGQVLRQALSSAARAALAPALRAFVEEEESHDGTLEVLHADAPEGSAYHYGLRTGAGQWLTLQFARGGPPLLTGTAVRVSGVRVEQAMAVGGSESVSVLAMSPLPGTFGERRVLVILLRFLDSLPSAVASSSAAEATMFGAATSVSAFFRESSYQQMWLSGTVVGPLLIAMTSAGCNYNQIATLANQAAATIGGIVLGQYHHIVYQFPRNGCTWSGLGSVGGSPGRAWINGGLGRMVAAHELGHNLGLYHSHALECGAVTMGGSCNSIEYGDVFDVMGGGGGPTHFNAVQKDLLGWLDYGVSPPITNVVASGTYTLDGFEPPGTDPKALRVPTALGDWYYVEYRRPIGFDSYLTSYPNVMGGVLVHYFDGGRDGVFLLDMTPATSAWTDPALIVGATFQDVAGGVTITPVWVNGTTAGINVTVAGGGSGCGHAAPTVTVTPGQQQGPPGATLAYTVSVRNNGTGCGTSVFDLQAALPPAWTGTFGSPSLTIAENATGSTVLQVTSTATAAAGTYALTVATSEAGLSGSIDASYTIIAAGGGSPGSFVDSFDRPDAGTLGNGWMVSAGDLQIISGQARNAPTKVLHMAVQPGLSGADQTVSATFASQNNNVAPRFGVVLRYGGPGNYYLCYRQLGGSSMLRILKVVGGVETILKSVAVGNPAQGSQFTLSCQASLAGAGGSTLTLKLDGATKATTTDASLVTGSVGFAMGGNPGGGASHRADNFSATVQ